MTASSWVPPSEFEEYQIQRSLGRGGMGEVFLARDTILDRPVAIKFIRSDPDPVSRQRLFLEARAAARLQHPNVVVVYRVGQVAGRPYIVSEFVRGMSLDKLPKPMAWDRVLEIALGLVRGLAAAHRAGVLHRDIKPANAILTESGEPKLVDFGLAKVFAAGTAAPAGETPPALERTRPPSEPRLAEASQPPATITPAKRGELMLAALEADTRSFVSPNGRDDTTPALAGLDQQRIAGLTAPGGLVGTPLYMPPELWRSSNATIRSDIYSFGVLLYELCAGRPPWDGVAFAHLESTVVDHDAPPLLRVAAGVPAPFAAVVDRCLRRDPDQRFASADELCDALEQLTVAGSAGADLPEGSPYRGLHAFEAEHAAVFFGRDAEIRHVIEQLRQDPFVLVAGDSGVGKSSLCRAGVLPRVAGGALGSDRAWKLCTMTPGPRPVHTVAHLLCKLVDDDHSELVRALLGGDAEEVARRIVRRLGDTDGLCLFVDQLEEIAVLGDRSQAAAFAELVAGLASGAPGIRILATARADFLTKLAAIPGFGAEVTRGLYLLSPLDAGSMRRAIVGPAAAKGFHFEDDALVDTLAGTALAADDGGLPLLQFALSELWEARDVEHYVIRRVALDRIGGVSGALARHADAVLARLLPVERAAACKLLGTLVTPRGTRARCSGRDLGAGERVVERALGALIRGRLVVAREGEDGASYELAHEALIQGWPTLRELLDREAGARALRFRLQQAAAEWDRVGRRADSLWSVRQLGEMDRLGSIAVDGREAEFVAASRRAVRRKRIRVALIAVGVPLAIAALYAGLSLRARRDQQRRVDALTDQAGALVARARRDDTEVERLRGEAFALFDDRQRDQAEPVWARARDAAAEVDRQLSDAGKILDSALALDPDRHDVRSAMAELLYARALHAERDGRHDQLAEVVQRLEAVDRGGVLRARWRAPGRLAIQTSPPGARVVVARYAGERGGARRLVDARAAGTTPLRDLELGPGSYRFELSAPGRSTVHYPIVIRRGEAIDLSIAMPERSAIPDGFVYVPAGRFLFGSGGDETLRNSFFRVAPLHPVHTGGYLIARTETTYRQWLDYVASLPPAERAQRLPFAEASLGNVSIKDLGGGQWELTMVPADRAYTARSGQPIVYAGRSERASQDWLEFPVGGIAWEDANAYVAWLDRTGRVPRARLCSEKEWERAARGADDREFPHGDVLEPEDANHNRTYREQLAALGPDEVGSHPASESPFGVHDLVGNVWEWTSSSLTGDPVALRGGSYFFEPVTNRSINREGPSLALRALMIGVRVCADLPSP